LATVAIIAYYLASASSRTQLRAARAEAAAAKRQLAAAHAAHAATLAALRRQQRGLVEGVAALEKAVRARAV
jgi:Tfp pilus assembly protein PilO